MIVDNNKIKVSHSEFMGQVIFWATNYMPLTMEIPETLFIGENKKRLIEVVKEEYSKVVNS